tara:strand:- start:2288 stop:3898 length:1611 start_codon:yes stop_codon:yes gene_type:complete
MLSFSEASFLASIYNLITHITDPVNSNFFFDNKNIVYIKNLFDLDSVSFYLILSGLIMLIVTALKVLNIYLNTFLYYKINSIVCSKIFLNTISQELEFHNNINSSSLISAVTEKGKSAGEITFFILSIIKSLFMLMTITILAIYISSKTFLLFFFIFLILFLIIYISFKKKIKNIGIQIALYNDKVIKVLQENYSSIIFIILYNCQKTVSKTFFETIKILRKSESRIVFYSSVPYIFIQTFTVLFVLFFINFYELKNNFVSLVPLATMWLLAIQRLIPSFNEIFSSLSSIKSLQQNFLDIEKLIKLTVQDNNQPTKENTINFNNEISFQDISFSFKENSPLIFHNLNFKIKKNSIFGIKGETGSGKSTLIRILMGYYKLNHGKILVDKKQLFSRDLGLWQKNISYVPQKVFLIDETIQTNIAFAEDKIDEVLMKQAIQYSNLEDFVEKQHNGMQTLIGENADRISGGQKQRIGIARAIYKNTNILILDESLNSLDYKTKINIINNFKKLNKTIILISHDESDLEICDNILNMDDLK